MGCVLNKQEELTDPNSQRRYLLRFATQSSKHVKYLGCPELTQDEKTRLVSSAQRYFEFIDASRDINQFTDLCTKYPRVVHTYFKNIPSDAQWSSTSPAGEDEILVNKADLFRHTEVSKSLIKHCVEKLAAGNTEDIEDSLRRIGAGHAECWVCSKDILLFEESFIWSLDKSDPNMDQKSRNLWRKVVRFILHNITIGINSHYDKLRFVLGQEKARFFFFESRPPNGVNPKSYDSLKRLNSYIKAQN